MLIRFALPVCVAIAATAPAGVHAEPDVPQFATLDRVDGTTRFTADASVSLWDDDLGADIVGVGLQLHGQYVAPMGAGGYLTLPLSYGSLHVDTGIGEVDENEFAIGNLELGGLYAVPPSGRISIVLRGGLALATATDDVDNLAAPNVYTAFARITDIVLFPEDTSTLRLSASALGDFGQFVFRADGGIDVPFGDDGDDEVFNDEDPLLRLNLGCGVKFGSAAVMAELATLVTTGDADEDRAIHTLALTARLLSAGAQPMLSVALPLDDGLDDLIDVVILFGVTAELDTEGR